MVSVLKGAVVGGGLELASATHLRVAEDSTFYALPEGQHGLFVGGGRSVRVPRLIGVHRMTDMMLTGRVLDAEEGTRWACRTTAPGRGGAGPRLRAGPHRRRELRDHQRRGAPGAAADRRGLPDHGFMMESLVAAVASSSAEAQERMRAFLDGRGGKVRR